MSYNLQRELEGCRSVWKSWKLHWKHCKSVADASFFTQPHDYTQKVLAELSQAEQALEEAFERWEYLESLKNGA